MPRGCTPSVPCLGLSRFSLSEAVEEFPGSLYILTVVWGMSGRPEIASLWDAGVRSFSLAPDCSSEGLHPFGFLSGVIEIQPLRGCLTQIGLGI